MKSLEALQAGATVLSRKIGCKPAFVGTLIRLHSGLYNHEAGEAWLVRCPQGLHWHRTRNELALIDRKILQP